MESIAIRIAPAALWLAVLWWWESRGEPRPMAGPDRYRHGARNLSLAGMNALLLFLTLGSASVAVAAASPVDVPPRWGWVHASACFVTLDAFSYFWHRLNHAVPWLWRLHAVHHTDEAMDVTTAARFHVGELALAAVLRMPLLFVLGVSPGVLVAYETTLTLSSMFHHSRIRLGRWDRVVAWFVASPRMHSVHHSRDPRHFHSNYASILSIWDRIFGSFNDFAGVVDHGLDGADGLSTPQLLRYPMRRSVGVDDGR